MNSPSDSHSAGVLEMLGVLGLVAGSTLLEIAGNLARVIAPEIAHSALVIFTEDCAGRPQKKAGDPSIIERVPIAELDMIRAHVEEKGGAVHETIVTIAGGEHTIASWIASPGSLLALVNPRGQNERASEAHLAKGGGPGGPRIRRPGKAPPP